MVDSKFVLYQKLVEWKNTHQNNCLMVKGARQVGKTYLIREFGKKENQILLPILYSFFLYLSTEKE